MASEVVFPNYQQMKRFIPTNVWHAIRVGSVGFALGLILILFVRPDIGLRIFWGLIIPTAPLLFFIAPGVWRNICPMAALNQTPRVFNFTRRLTAPKWFQEYGYVIAIAIFLIIVPNRKVLFNENGPALALLMILLYSTAFIMGVYFKGKSGWCSSICPLLPVQRIYGQTPFLKVANSHCQPSEPEPGGCVGCTKNCYDFNPHVAYLADLYEDDRYFSGYRKFFVGLFPGFIFAFYTLDLSDGILAMYFWFTLYSLASAGSFFLLDSFFKVTPVKITTLYGAGALNLYYWFNSTTLSNLFPETVAPGLAWALWAFVLVMSFVWIYNTYKKETTFVEQIISPESINVSIVGNESIVIHGTKNLRNPEVVFEPNGKRIAVEKGRTLLEVAENNDIPLEPGCRQGICGADPVCITSGMENLSKMNAQERQTVERLNLGKNGRMACVARVKGPVKVSLTCDEPDEFVPSSIVSFNYDQSVNKVVIVGNGIAGVTAADHVRRRHPKCEIHLIGRESHNLYNRMGITRLIYGRSAMQGLYLMPEKWYKDLKITTWLNTHVTRIDPQAQQIHLGTGETLAYDRLILTTGSRAFVPPIDGFGRIPGSFVLREAADAMAIRSYVQENRCQEAVVAGGGLLGLEAAYGLHKLGLKVTVLERSASLLRRQLDARGGDFLREYLEGLGMTIAMKAEAASVYGRKRLKEVRLKDGRVIPTDLFLVCAGIRSETQLGRDIGIKSNRGLLVNKYMQTSHRNIFAAGDVAEFNKKVFGLWAVAVSQAEVAAANAVSKRPTEVYTEIVPVTALKVVGIDINSIGKINATSNQEEEIVLEDLSNQRYRKLIISNGKIVGAILLGYPREAPGVAEAVKSGFNVTPHLKQLRKGEWKVLVDLAS